MTGERAHGEVVGMGSADSEIARLTVENEKLRAELAEAKTRGDEAAFEVAACLDFLRTEMDWAYFRAEMLYSDDEPKKTASESNAKKLKNYLVGSGHGKAIAERFAALAVKVELAKEALEEIDCGNAQCHDGWSGCDHKCALHARAAKQALDA